MQRLIVLYTVSFMSTIITIVVVIVISVISLLTLNDFSSNKFTIYSIKIVSVTIDD